MLQKFDLVVFKEKSKYDVKVLHRTTFTEKLNVSSRVFKIENIIRSICQRYNVSLENNDIDRYQKEDNSVIVVRKMLKDNSVLKIGCYVVGKEYENWEEELEDILENKVMEE